MLGRPPFYATELTTSGDVAYIGGNWERDVAFAGYSVPLQVCDTRIGRTVLDQVMQAEHRIISCCTSRTACTLLLCCLSRVASALARCSAMCRASTVPGESG